MILAIGAAILPSQKYRHFVAAINRNIKSQKKRSRSCQKAGIPIGILAKMEKEYCFRNTLFGAGNQNRTDDLVITNDVLYRLSHTSTRRPSATFALYHRRLRLSSLFSKKYRIFAFRATHEKTVFFFPFLLRGHSRMRTIKSKLTASRLPPCSMTIPPSVTSLSVPFTIPSDPSTV